MEVHHHPHVEKKRFKEYFFEFVMIFLAVTLGFFAENIREHIAETHREKQYVQSLYRDLQIDTAVLHRTIGEKMWIAAKYDSALEMLSGKIPLVDGFIYYMEQYTKFNDVFTSQDVTYEQLKSSGTFRYFKQTDLYRELADYYNLYSRYQAVDGQFGFRKEEMQDYEVLLFDPPALAALYNEHAQTFYDLVNRPEGKVFTPVVQDRQALRSLYFRFADGKHRASGSQLFLSWLQGKATKIVDLLKQEYHLH